jgi:fused signal recognition particle receptor
MKILYNVKIIGGIMSIFSAWTDRKINDEILDEIEEVLIASDLGVSLTNKILIELRKNKYDKDITKDDIKQIIAKYIRESLKDIKKPLNIPTKKPYILMFLGINGSGKTTTIGKIINKFKKDGKKVIIAASDTFRIGAVEQLAIWSNKNEVRMIQAEKTGQDPTSVAYKALEIAKNEDYDILLIDTAGRMQNNINLMQELQKIARVINVDESILVLDATIGQNALKQVESFNKCINLTGLIMNKLDGTAKGGILIPIYEKFKKPIYAIGVGEGIDDIKEFDVEWYINKILNQ